MEQPILKRTVRRYVIAWYNGLGGRPDYSTRSFDSIEEAQAAAERALGTEWTAASLTASSIQSHTARRRNYQPAAPLSSRGNRCYSRCQRVRQPK